MCAQHVTTSRDAILRCIASLVASSLPKKIPRDYNAGREARG
jgi:hypothetical protein